VQHVVSERSSETLAPRDTRDTKWPLYTLAAPGCILAVALAAALLLAVVGRHPMWRHEDLNLSEAAGARDEAEAVRLIGYGEDPNARRELRAGILFDRPVRLTPLEAAVARRDSSMIVRLLSAGALMDAETWNRLRCLSEGDEVPPVLDARRPADAVLHCDGVSAPW
jgi:hypothetical protein